jgi:hypothetical protein
MIIKSNKHNIHIHFPKIDFRCPYCKKKYIDKDEKYYKRISKNKSGITYIKCECRNRFGVAINMTGDMVAFK